MSIIRRNLMNEKGYSPYCGNDKCKVMPRTRFNGKQFDCAKCGWQSKFPVEFIKEYTNKWDDKSGCEECTHWDSKNKLCKFFTIENGGPYGKECMGFIRKGII